MQYNTPSASVTTLHAGHGNGDRDFIQMHEKVLVEVKSQCAVWCRPLKLVGALALLQVFFGAAMHPLCQRDRDPPATWQRYQEMPLLHEVCVDVNECRCSVWCRPLENALALPQTGMMIAWQPCGPCPLVTVAITPPCMRAMP